MAKGLNISHKALLLVIVPLVFEIAFVGALFYMLERAQEQVRKDRSFVLCLNTVLGRTVSASRTLGEFGVTSDEKYLKQYRETMKPVPGALQTLRDLVNSNKTATQTEREEALQTINGLGTALEVVDQELSQQLEEDSGDNPLRLMGRMKNMRSLMKKLGPSAEKFGSGFANMREGPEEIERSSRRIKMLLIAGVTGNVFLALFLALYFSKGTVRRLDQLMDDTRRLVRGEQLNPLVGGTDEIAHLDVVFKDMAEKLIAAAKKERAIVDNAADVIGALDDTGKVSAVNPACSDVWHLQQKEMVGTDFCDLLIEDDRDAARKALSEAKASGKTVNFETRSKGKENTVVHVGWSVQWSERENLFYFVAHDISARKELETLKQEFVSMVSHDLRSPLTSIQAFLSMLADGTYGDLPEKVSKKAELADRNAMRLIRLINDLLDIERMETGQLPMDMQVVAASEIVESSIEGLRGISDYKKLQITSVGHAEIFGDRDRLEQVLVNLLGNAVKFSPDGAAIDISITEVGDLVEIRVKDYGRGIPAKALSAIFDRFKQVETADATKKKGSGLGLAISKAIVEQHGGVIGVDSVEGEGSAFWFRVPKAASATIKIGDSIVVA